MKKILAVIFIFSGIMLMLYPKITQLYSSYKQNKLIDQWEHQASANNTIPVDSYKKLDEVFANDNTDQSTDRKIDSNQMIGTIEIKKINLKLPILEGASQDNLKIAAGHLEGTALPGESGNSAIAAHRSRSFGKMFNRLNEIKIGDEITVTDQNQTYIYKVYETMIVTPDDLSVLEGNGKDQILTLITCDPITTATHRLIVHAKIERMN